MNRNTATHFYHIVESGQQVNQVHREIFWGADLRRSAGDIFAQICDPVGSLWKKKFIKNCVEFQENKVLQKSSKLNLRRILRTKFCKEI